jgi:hypothetical protein
MRRALIFRTTLFALVACSACARPKPSADADLADASAPAPAPAMTSRFSAPLDYDFTAVLRVVEKVVPTTFGSLDSVRMVGTDTRRHYAFVADRGRFTAFAEGNLLHLSATLHYAARGYYKPVVGPTIGAGCGNDEERPRIVIELTTPLTLSPDWRLVSHARIARVEPASTEPRDHCDVSVFHHDVTGRVVDAARSGLTNHLPDIDRMIGGIDLRRRVVEWWGLLARPITLTEGVWLVLAPERLNMGTVSGHDHVLRIPVSLDAHPRIVTGVAPPDAPATDLPPLTHDTIASGFHIVMDGVVDYFTASRAINDAFGDRPIALSGRTITINTVTVIPAAHGSVVLSVGFTGDAKGNLRLRGTPHYNPARREITVPDLDFELATNSQIINAYSWLESDALRGTFREKARVPVDPALERGRTLLLGGLNRKIGDALTLSATVDALDVRGVFVTLGGLIVRAEATGHAAATVVPR